MKKGWLIGCGLAGILGVGVCAGVTVLVYGIMAITQPVVDSSNEFLGLLGQEKFAEAYAATANGYRAQQDEQSFTAAAKQLGMTKFASASWNQREIKNQLGKTEGSATGKDGSVTPVRINHVSEDGKWKVVNVNYGGVDLVTIKAQAPVPADAELRRMALDALLDLNQAIKAKDFAPFYDKVSDALKKSTTPEKLQVAFQGFIDKKIDIGPIKDVVVAFDPPPLVTDKGELIIKGRYPTQPVDVRFTLNYILERGDWKMTFIRVNVGKD